MPYTYALLAGLLASLAISSMAAGASRRAREDLPPDVRERILNHERRLDWLWHAAEWAGILLILLGMFTTVISKLHSTRVLAIAGGLALFCAANCAGAWYVCMICRREASNTKAARTTLLCASFVTFAEALLIGIVLWIVSSRLGWFAEKPAPESVQSEPAESENGVWIDEAAAMKQLSQQDKEYVQGLIDSGALRTKTVAGKRVFNADDVEKVKNKKKDVIPD